MSRDSQRGGFSLIEILVAMVLLLLIITLIMQVVIPMSRGAVRGSQQIELQQVGTTALNRLADDLQAAAPAGVTRYPTTGLPAPNEKLMISIQALTGVDTLGQQTWSEQLIIYWWKQEEGKLHRMTWPPGYPMGRRPDIDEPFKPTYNELDRLTDNPRGHYKLLGQIKKFDVNLAQVPHVLSLTLEAPAPDGAPPESFTLERRVYLRNERY